MNKLTKRLAIKILLLITVSSLLLASLSGCSNKKDTEPQTQTIESLGLEYKTPAEWNKYLSTSIYRYVISPKGALAMVTYYLISEAGFISLSQNPDTNLNEYLVPLCSIMVCSKEEALDTARFEQLTNEFGSIKKLSEQGSYEYYGLWDYDVDYNIMSDKDYENYGVLTGSVSKLMDSVVTSSFDPSPILESIDLKNNTLTFSTTTLAGEEIDSRIFSEYDMTMVYFWGSTCLPDINELESVQAVYENIQTDYPNVNLILAATDTPDAAAEEAINKAMLDAGCTFDAIRMDSYIGTWVIDNLEAIPTTVFVDKNGEIVGEKLKGIRGMDGYLEEIKTRLAEAISSGAVDDVLEAISKAGKENAE